MRRVFIYSMGKAPSQFDEFNSAIIKALPEEVGQAFQELSPKEKIYRLHSWIDEFYALSAEGMRSREIPEQELAHFFAEELEPAVRERLLALPREEMQQELQRLYKGQRSKRWREMFRDRADRNQAPAGPPSEDRRRGGRRGGPGPQGRGERGGPWFDGPSGRPQRGPGRDPQQERQPRRPPPPSVDRPSPDEQ